MIDRLPRKVALLVAGHDLGLQDASAALDHVAAALPRWGFTELVRCEGAEGTRTKILAVLDRLVRQARADDCYAIYYVGHGAKARFRGGLHPGHEPERVWPYLHTRPEREGFSGLLAVELSERIHALTSITRNVTVVLDCCFAPMVRVTARLPSEQTFDRPEDERLAARVAQIHASPASAISHPATVRLYATSLEAPASWYGAGRFTSLLLKSLERRRARDLPWAGHIAWVREHLAHEGRRQLPQMLGPGGRLPFRLDVVDVAGHVSVNRDLREEDTWWIRAGRLHGIRDGVELDLRHLHNTHLRARVTATEDHYARVEFTGKDRPQIGAIGFVCDGVERHGLCLRGEGAVLDAIRERLERSIRLELLPDAPLRLRVGAELAVDDEESDLCLRRPLDQIDAMLDDLDAIARARTWTRVLDDILAKPEPSKDLYETSSWSWRVVRYDRDGGRHAIGSPAHLHVGDHIDVELVNDSTRSVKLSFNLVDRGLEHALHRLNASPAGFELPNDARARRLFGPPWGEGSVPVEWAEQVPMDRPRHTRLYLLVTTRPIDLAPILTPTRAPTTLQAPLSRAERPPIKDMRRAVDVLDVWIDPEPRP